MLAASFTRRLRWYPDTEMEIGSPKGAICSILIFSPGTQPISMSFKNNSLSSKETIFASVKKHGKCLVVTEEPMNNSFAQSIAARISKTCFEYLDAPVEVIGSENLPAIPLNSTLEQTMIPSAEKVAVAMKTLFDY